MNQYLRISALRILIAGLLVLGLSGSSTAHWTPANKGISGQPISVLVADQLHSGTVYAGTTGK